MALTEAMLNGSLVQSSDVDNDVATATASAIAAQRHFVGGINADYSAAVAAIRTVTLKFGTTTIHVWRHDFTGGRFETSLPFAVHGDYNQAVSVELQASGSGGTTGRVGFGKCTV